MRRISVVGPSGSGKTTLGAALAERLGVPFLELDGVFHQPEWTELDPDEFARRVGDAASADGWVIDGNYAPVVRDGIVWERADTVVWLDLPKRVVMRQVVGRTLRRMVRREVLWNGNRERWRNLVSRDPEQSIILWAWRTHGEVRERYEGLARADAAGRVRWVRLQSRREIEAFLDRVGAGSFGDDRRPY